MRNPSHRIRSKRQRGSVAVEASLIITLILIPLLAFILLFGRYFWYYTVAQKAVHDATLYLASAPLADIRSNAASGLARRIIESETADLDTSTASTLAFTTECWFRIPANSANVAPFPCATNAVLAVVRVSVSMTVTDPFLSPFTQPTVGSDGFSIIAAAGMRYAGR